MTILGRYSVAETKGMIKLVDYRFGEVDKGFNRIPDTFKAQHPDVYADLAHDWETEKKHWADVKSDVNGVMNSLTRLNPVPEDLLASDDEYRKVLGFLEYGGNTLVDGKTSERRKGDLRDCQTRIEQILGQPINLEGRPDVRGKDYDIDFYKKTGGVIAAAKQAPADVAKDAREAGTRAAKENPMLAVGLVGAVGIAIVLAIKTLIPPVPVRR